MADYDSSSANRSSSDPTLPLETTAAPYLGQGNFAELQRTDSSTTESGRPSFSAIGTGNDEGAVERFTVRPTGNSQLLDSYHQAINTDNAMEDSMNNTDDYMSGNTSQSDGDNLGQQASEAMDQAKSKLGETVQQVQEQAQTQITAQKYRAADSLGTIADALRQTGQQLQGQEQRIPVDRLVNSAANQVERVASYLRETDVNQMVGQVESAIRRQPALALGAAFAIGLIGARFLKSSTQQANHGYPGDQYYGYGRDSYGTQMRSYPRAETSWSSRTNSGSVDTSWSPPGSTEMGQGAYDGES